MILLDTNVVSEPMLPNPNAGVIGWLDSQFLETVYISVITVAEIRYGLAILPEGRRRDLLTSKFEGEVLPLFEDRVLAFDLAASQAYENIMAVARASGRGIGTADGYIAAIARAHGLMVATRDTAPFIAAGLEVIDPWAPGS